MRRLDSILNLAGISILLSLNSWIEPANGGLRLNSRFPTRGCCANERDSSYWSRECQHLLQGILAVSLLALGGNFAMMASKAFRRGIRRPDHTTLLLFPILSSLALLAFPELHLPASMALAMSFALLAYGEVNKPEAAIKKKDRAPKSLSSGNLKALFTHFSFQLRTSLDQIIHHSENMIESGEQSKKELENIVRQSDTILDSWQSVLLLMRLLQRNLPT